MNDFLTWRRVLTATSGVVAPQEVNLNVPEGFSAKLYDFAVYASFLNDSRYGINLYRSPVPADGGRVWNGSIQVLADGGVLAALFMKDNFVTSGNMAAFWPHTEHLWPLDYRVSAPMRIAGFTLGNQDIGFRLRYQLIRQSVAEIAAILSWQGMGVKVE